MRTTNRSYAINGLNLFMKSTKSTTHLAPSPWHKTFGSPYERPDTTTRSPCVKSFTHAQCEDEQSHSIPFAELMSRTSTLTQRHRYISGRYRKSVSKLCSTPIIGFARSGRSPLFKVKAYFYALEPFLSRNLTKNVTPTGRLEYLSYDLPVLSGLPQALS